METIDKALFFPVGTSPYVYRPKPIDYNATICTSYACGMPRAFEAEFRRGMRALDVVKRDLIKSWSSFKLVISVMLKLYLLCNGCRGKDVEVIVGKFPSTRQSLLFPATMPDWVKKLARRYLDNPLMIALVGDQEEKLAEGIKLYAIPITASLKHGPGVYAISQGDDRANSFWKWVHDGLNTPGTKQMLAANGMQMCRLHYLVQLLVEHTRKVQFSLGQLAVLNVPTNFTTLVGSHSREAESKVVQQRVTLRLLTSWFDIPWEKLEAIKAMIIPPLGTLILVIGANGFVATANVARTVASSVTIAASFGAAEAEPFVFPTDIERVTPLALCLDNENFQFIKWEETMGGGGVRGGDHERGGV
ncbi:hypothetical protein Nepgr_003051 [Nepenthes gracilis]|uniref:Uncharacterized protein n=1 Tax=Nepenthes gracilis TaxID=150966 RepID=A0AAD3XCV3_NEPGR|nr:hypothetical protein Nepgr_003051 [Nepenthes gracilis]